MYVHTAPSCRRSVCAAKTVRILAIGNSFSQDAVEQYLHELAEAEGISTIIGNMFIGGCSLERHVKMPVTMLLPMPTGKSVQMEKTGKG